MNKTKNESPKKKETNKDFHEIESPLKKEFSWNPLKKFSKRKMERQDTPTSIIEREIQQEDPSTERIKQALKDLKENTKESNTELNEPLLELIRENGEIEWFEGAKPGEITITGTDGKEHMIVLPKSRLLTDHYNNGKPFRKWIAYENELAALPGNIIGDSKLILQIVIDLLSNKANLEAKKLEAMSKLIWPITFLILGIILISWLILPAFTGKTLPQWINGETDEKVIQKAIQQIEKQQAKQAKATKTTNSDLNLKENSEWQYWKETVIT